ncbi:MAG: hypothetical protein EBS50_10765 [Sphingomonadaceae bacterium]|nr:hypothetical protein [Sphingomonadaceae bacterium]
MVACVGEGIADQFDAAAADRRVCSLFIRTGWIVPPGGAADIPEDISHRSDPSQRAGNPIPAHVAVHKIDVATAKSRDFVAVQQKTAKPRKFPF